MAMQIGHVHIKTYDPKKTAQFYIDNFGATMKSEAANGNIQLNLHGLQLNVTTISAAQNRKQMMGIEHIACRTTMPRRSTGSRQTRAYLLEQSAARRPSPYRGPRRAPWN